MYLHHPCHSMNPILPSLCHGDNIGRVEMLTLSSRVTDVCKYIPIYIYLFIYIYIYLHHP